MNLRTAALVLALVACRRAPVATQPDTPPASGSSATPAAAQAPAPTPTPAPTPAPAANAVARDDVQQVLDAWLRAQNGGDFAAYQQLYAARFEGVRRSGARVRRFDRAGWMGDRGRMFQSTMQVSMRDVTVSGAVGVASARFTQEFAQGTYRDVGTKEITLVREGARLVIAREEMLDSTITGQGTAGANATAPGEFALVVTHGGQRWAILAQVPDEAAWTQGAPALVSAARESDVVTRRAVRADALPESLRALDRAAVRAYNRQGAACEMRLGALTALSRVDVHFGVEQHWQGDDGSGTPGTPMTPDAIAAEAWDMGAQVLAAPLDDAAQCQGAVWLRLASLPAVPVFAPTDAAGALRTAVQARVRALPAWRELEQAYRGDGAARPRVSWDAHDRTPMVPTVWQAQGSPRRFAFSAASVMVGGCAEFSGAYAAVFEVGAANALTPLADPQTAPHFEPLAAADFDGDGVPEFVVTGGLARKQGNAYARDLFFEVPNRDCGC